MSDPELHAPPSPAPPGAGRAIRCWKDASLLTGCLVSGWGACLLLIALLWGQHRAGVLHPHAWPVLLLLGIILLSAMTGTAAALWRLIRGPRRSAAIAQASFCILPFGFWCGLAIDTVRQGATGNAFAKNLFSDLELIGVAALMEGQVWFVYPHRLESTRLIMFYDDRVRDPQRDLDAMDRHVANLEAAIGRRLPNKIHWVRGEVFGRRQFAIRGLAFGSAQSPADWNTADSPFSLSVDRHELAHGVIHQFQPPDCDAPTLLIEGYAEAQSGMSTLKRAELAIHSRGLWRERTAVGQAGSYLSELTEADRYHAIDGAIYSVGGAFAEFVIRKFGTERFLQLYFTCRPGEFEKACSRVLGVSLPELELDYWAEVEQLTNDSPPPRKN